MLRPRLPWQSLLRNLRSFRASTVQNFILLWRDGRCINTHSFSSGLLIFERSKWRQHRDPGFMERVVGRSHLNAYLPVTAHNQVAGAAEMAFPIRLQVRGIGSHIHIQDCGVERYSHIGDWRARPGICHAHLEAVGTSTIRIDGESDRQFAILCLCRRVKWCSGSSW
jgi:hypothetical protein